jgi:hypothetical protein
MLFEGLWREVAYEMMFEKGQVVNAVVHAVV